MDNGLFKVAMKTVGKTFLVILSILGFSLCFINAFFPRFSADVYGRLNLVKPQAVMFEMVYNKTGDIEDLYNVIESSLKTERYFEASKYIKKMQTSKKYAEFCQKINQNAVIVAPKEMLVYVADYDAYLSSQYVKSLFMQNKISEAESVAIEGLINSTNINSWEFGCFIDCVYSSDKLSKAEKYERLASLYTKDVGGQSIDELIMNRFELLDSPEENEGLAKLQVYYGLMQIKMTYRDIVFGYCHTLETDETVFNSVLDEIEGNSGAVQMLPEDSDLVSNLKFVHNLSLDIEALKANYYLALADFE